MLETGLSNPRPNVRQLMYADKVARMQWAELVQSGGLTLTQAIAKTIDNGNLWSNKIYEVPDEEFPECGSREPEAKHPRVEAHGGKGYAGKQFWINWFRQGRRKRQVWQGWHQGYR